MKKDNNVDIIIIGGGHAGAEAGLASARMGMKTALFCLNLETLGLMSCNPAIGGVGKGQLVKEIDALGGEMGKAADATAVQFRMLNTSRGAAVRSSRCQSDKKAYNKYIKSVLEKEKNLLLVQGEVVKILVSDGKITGVETASGEIFHAETCVVATGTFLDGLIHIGMESSPGGRVGEPPSVKLAENLGELGLRIMRFKTGTCPRLNGKTINYSILKKQEPDKYPVPFSFGAKSVLKDQLPCYVTYTNKKTHDIIRSGLDRSPLYSGKIKSIGVRYCPSIEDKIVKFPDKERHQIFLESEGRDTDEVYPNGISTSLPLDIQLKMVHSIEGLENVEIIRPGYGIEHCVVEPTQLLPTLETKSIRGLFLAGQINGTTGYEEAAAQGLVAGINAALKVKKKHPLILDRSTGYIGVLIDDLVTKGTNEPYRMFTSRVEYRLIIREDNADIRLREFGHKVGLVGAGEYKEFKKKIKDIEEETVRLKKKRVKPSAKLNSKLKEWGSSPLENPISLEALLKRPQVSYKRLSELGYGNDNIKEDAKQQVELTLKYEGYFKRELGYMEKFKDIEKIRIPNGFDYPAIPGLSREIKEKLMDILPLNLGQAGRISGVTPSAVSILMIYLKKFREREKSEKS